MKLTLALSLQAASILAASGSLSFLTANIAGLPAFINSNGVPGDKTTNTARIGQLFAKYGHDIIHVQEDFAYHDTLYANDNHTYRTVTSGNVPFGSGLNTLANYGWTDLQRKTWSKCYINEGDCLTPKGFTYMRMQLPGGASVDLYNVHHDAGSDPNDIAARKANTKQVVDHINQYSKGQAVIVGGDTNSRYTRTGDGIRQFKDLAGLDDAWVELIMGGKAPAEGSSALLCENPSTVQDCEIVDKVLYRRGDSVDLQATSFRYAGVDYRQPDGNSLTDHDLILVNFAWSQDSDC